MYYRVLLFSLLMTLGGAVLSSPANAARKSRTVCAKHLNDILSPGLKDTLANTDDSQVITTYLLPSVSGVPGESFLETVLDGLADEAGLSWTIAPIVVKGSEIGFFYKLRATVKATKSLLGRLKLGNSSDDSEVLWIGLRPDSRIALQRSHRVRGMNVLENMLKPMLRIRRIELTNQVSLYRPEKDGTEHVHYLVGVSGTDQVDPSWPVELEGVKLGYYVNGDESSRQLAISSLVARTYGVSETTAGQTVRVKVLCRTVADLKRLIAKAVQSNLRIVRSSESSREFEIEAVYEAMEPVLKDTSVERTSLVFGF